MYRVVARKGENLSNSYLFLQSFSKTKCYITLIDAQNVVCAIQSSILT